MVELSIIIPHYNSVNSLKKLLLSIPKREDIQVIVVDDRSNEQINEFNNLTSNSQYDNVLFLSNKTDKKGAGVCRNIGLNHVTGKWVLFADSDDFFIDGFYEKLIKYFSSNYDVVYFTPTSLEIDTGKKSDRHINYENLINDYISEANITTETRLRYRFFVPWSKLIKNELLTKNNIKFDEVLASNDVLFSTKVGYHMEYFTAVEDVIYCVTRGYGTLTTNINSMVFESRLSVFVKNYKYLSQRLSKKEFSALHLHGMGIIYNSFRYKLGIRKAFSIFILLKKNRIRILDSKLINPIYSINIMKEYYIKYKKDKRFLLDRS